MSTKTLKLTPAEAEHIYQALLDQKEDGHYYGVKAHFYKRTDTLIEKMKQVMEAD